MPLLDIEYTARIKKKIELILQILIKEYGLEELISNKFRYRIDFDIVTGSKFYKFFEEKKNANGQPYHRGSDFIPQGFQEWLCCNFPDYMYVEQVYNHVSKVSYITQNELRKLNEIYQKHNTGEINHG